MLSFNMENGEIPHTFLRPTHDSARFTSKLS